MRAGSARCGGGDGWRTGIPWRGQKRSGGSVKGEEGVINVGASDGYEEVSLEV